MVSRREFLKKTALGAGALLLEGSSLSGGCPRADCFALNHFVESHPDAVFVLCTHVDTKTDAAQIKDVGYRFGRTLFVPGFAHRPHAISVRGPVVLKPNLTTWAWHGASLPETTMGIQTDPYFVEGLINSLTDLRVRAQDMYIREANYFPNQIDAVWYRDLAERTGIDLKGLDELPKLLPSDVQWAAVEGGAWFKNIAYLWPVSAPGSCLINIAKLKSHSMGMSLCSKNLQGTNVRPFVRHCWPWGAQMAGVDPADVVPDAFATIQAGYERHKTTIPRWKTLDGDPGNASAGGLWMETHSARCLDNNSVLRPLVNIIEGIYGREGPFLYGPGPDGYGVDLLTNLVIFGKNSFHVDNVGVFLAGHEPGNFGLFHMAMERGLSKYLDPRDIPVYEWGLDGSARRTSVEELPRPSIRTLYLPQPGEPQYHMVNQPYDYGPRSAPAAGWDSAWPPGAVVVENEAPGRPASAPSIQYFIPRSGDVRVEILDAAGRSVDVLVDAQRSGGDHLATWQAGGWAPGNYNFKMSFEGVVTTGSILLRQ